MSNKIWIVLSVWTVCLAWVVAVVSIDDHRRHKAWVKRTAKKLGDSLCVPENRSQVKNMGACCKHLLADDYCRKDGEACDHDPFEKCPRANTSNKVI